MRRRRRRPRRLVAWGGRWNYDHNIGSASDRFLTLFRTTIPAGGGASLDLSPAAGDALDILRRPPLD